MKLTPGQTNEYRRSVFVSRHDPAMESIQKLLDSQFEKVKTSLLRATIAEVPGLQGEAEAYLRVLKWITEPLASIDTQ